MTLLTLCVTSVFCPGSPFDPGYYIRARPEDVSTVPFYENTTHNFITTEDNLYYFNSTFHSISNYTSTEENISVETPSSQVSIALLMAGIIGARVGKCEIKSRLSKKLVDKSLRCKTVTKQIRKKTEI